jgi:hypothetical protein
MQQNVLRGVGAQSVATPRQAMMKAACWTSMVSISQRFEEDLELQNLRRLLKGQPDTIID